MDNKKDIFDSEKNEEVINEEKNLSDNNQIPKVENNNVSNKDKCCCEQENNDKFSKVENNNVCNKDKCCCEQENNDQSKELNIKEYIKILETKIKNLEKDFMNLNQTHENEKLRYRSDLENFTKRINKERIKERKYASMKFIENILVPFEQFEKVLEMNVENEILKKFLVGFQMIHQQMKNIFKEEGLKEIDSLGKNFDPKLHYAMEKISDKNQPNNSNIYVLQKGYLYKERVLKPAMVKVNEWSEEDDKDK
ncbi:MAG: nucleotide exchange factor GrpE [Candidatus Phytoplasma pyri]|uniref:nucleotide exchange factor GrpE n=1 Tax=Candidatus Phytoplasma pyri TaxID=47566 RepID=UPI0039830253